MNIVRFVIEETADESYKEFVSKHIKDDENLNTFVHISLFVTERQ